MRKHEIGFRELSGPLAPPADATLLATLDPIWFDRTHRPPYWFITQDSTHVRVTLRGQHVADARRCPEGGWELFAADAPARAIAWAGNHLAIRLAVHEALTLQATAAPGCYGWLRVHRQRLEHYQCPLAACVAA